MAQLGPHQNPSPKLQPQQTWWTASDHTRVPPNHFTKGAPKEPALHHGSAKATSRSVGLVTCLLQLHPALTVSQPEMVNTNKRWWCSSNYNRRAHPTHTGETPGASSSGDQKDCRTVPRGHFLHKATLSRPGDKAFLPNTQRYTQRSVK